MNWLDIVILCLLVIGLIKGLYDGVIKQVVSLVALIVGIYLCSGVAQWLCGYLIQLEWFPQGAVVVTGYFLGFLLIVGVIMLAGRIVNRIINATPLSIFNHLIGGLIGLVLMVVFISVLLNLVETVDHQSAILPQEIKVESRYYFMIKDIIPTLFPGNLFEWKNELFG
jgi:membrane protein required for colicin V production